MKTWIGLLFTVLGLMLGLGSTLLDDMVSRHTNYAGFLGLPLADLANHTTALVGLALAMMIASFFLIFANRENEIDY